MRVTLPDPAALIPGFAAAYAGQRAAERAGAEPAWQPVHTVYVPADVFHAGTLAEWGRTAAGLLAAHLRSPGALAGVFGVSSPALAAEVHRRVAAKLAAEPVEDLRIDFEDGYGGGDEDAHAESAARDVAALHAAGRLPRRWGVRAGSFATGDPVRPLRTLDGFLTAVTGLAGGLPPGFVITFPKVLQEAYLGQFAGCLAALERGLGLADGTLRFEMQVDDPRTLRFLRPGLVETAGGRLTAARLGVSGYTAACGLTPHEQRPDHPACDHARHVMQTAFAGTGVELADGSPAVVPATGSAADVRALWRRHAGLVAHALTHGYYQGGDTHPAHLVSRYTATYTFHLAHRADYTARLPEAGPATRKAVTTALTRARHALDD
ncbi:aldolase [Spongiactinospora rosea]|uniref:Aldolase n=1 Tax=Spongiactinospora rosea TaxID=2248750 RepID=A0A366LKU0_9ACTN|nr:aldolase [Spongiactinospora rosea]RBQ14437.1 aldolase [Spongiactinospora rosea]